MYAPFVRVRPIPGNIRNATVVDTAALSRLLTTTPANVNALLSRGHTLVLDRCDGTLGAAIHLDLVDGRATMDMLVVDPSLAGCDLEDRMTGVARALCEAYGCDRVETRAAR
jgi:hypothetical protein